MAHDRPSLAGVAVLWVLNAMPGQYIDRRDDFAPKIRHCIDIVATVSHGLVRAARGFLAGRIRPQSAHSFCFTTPTE